MKKIKNKTKQIKPIKVKKEKNNKLKPVEKTITAEDIEKKKNPVKSILGMIISILLIGFSVYLLIKGDKRGLYGIIAGVLLFILFARFHPKKKKENKVNS